MLAASLAKHLKREWSCVFAARVPTDGADEEEEFIYLVILMQEGLRSRLQG